MFNRIFILTTTLLFAILFFSSDKYNACAQPESNTEEIKLLHDSLDHYYNLGDKYFYQGYFIRAKNNYLKYLSLLQQYLPDDKNKFADVYITLGVISSKFWEFDKALEFYRKAEQLCDNDNIIKETLGRIYSSKGKIYKRLGEYQNAKKHYSIALNIFESDNIDDTNRNKIIKNYIIYIYNSLGVLYFEQKEYDNALSYYKKCKNLSNAYYRDFLPVTYENIADCYYKMKSYNEAEKYFKLAINNHLTGKNQNLKYLLASVYSCYSQLCLETNRFDKAYDLLQKAYKIYIKHWGINHPQTSECLLNFGKFFEKTGNLDSALYYYQKSILTVTEDFNEINIYNNPGLSKVVSNLHLIKSLKHKAQVLSDYYLETGKILNLKASLNTHDLAIQLIDKIRTGYQTRESKLFLSENEKKTYTDAIHTAYRLWQITGDRNYMYKAFEYAERSKAAILLSALRNTEAKSFGSVPDSLLEKENNLMRDIALYKELIYEEKRIDSTDKNKLKYLEKKLFDITNEYDNLITYFEDSFPKYYSLKYNNMVIDISSLQHALKKDQALIEYSLSDTSLFIFHVGKNKMNVIYKPIDSTFHKSLSAIINFLHEYDCSKTPVEDLTDYVDKSYYLYNILVKPVETSTKNKRLIIVPDGLLSFLPYEALINSTNITGRMSYRNLNYLIHKYIISYAISSTLYFRESPGIQVKRIRRLSAFAPVYDKPINTAEILIRTRQHYRDKLYPIPGVKDEVYSISKIISCDIFEGIHATERIFKDTARYYDLLHLSMHTIINNNNPMFSKLAFTEVNDSVEDGLLNTHEIYNMNINARLAVLSSCSSGEGILKKGEGVISLARAFMYAGCPSIVMTLWVVEDKSGIRLMTEFYKEIAKGMPKDKALRNSKLKFIEKENLTRSHPFYWSSYICVGTPEPLFYSTRKIILIISTIILAIAALILIKRILKIKKSMQGSGK